LLKYPLTTGKFYVIIIIERRNKMKKYTIKDFDKKFPDDLACLEWIKNHIYPEGIHCPKCQKITKHHKLTRRPCYSCDRCGNNVYPTAGTIFHKSTTPLKTWFRVIFRMASTRSGISAKQIQRETGVTYKTAWRMCKQIRELLDEFVNPMFGQVEFDETYIGGRRHGRRARGAEGKSIVAGIAQRDGNIVAVKVPDVRSATLLPFIAERILPFSIVHTDEMPSYNRLRQVGYRHKRIHHSSKVYVVGNVHTNTVDGFWSLLKRGINGVYHSVSNKYLQSYLNEYTFRYNHRNDEAPMFQTFLGQI